MRLPDFPDVPSIPSPGEILDEVKGVAQGVASGVGKVADTAMNIGTKAVELTGIGGIPGAIEETAKRIRDFTQQQIDSVLNSALSGIHSIEEFARKTAGTVKGEVEREVDLALKTATEVAKDLALVPVEAKELLADGERILKRAKVRRDELRAWKQRLRERKQKIPKILWEHLLEFETELDAELDLSAQEAEDIGIKAAASSRQAYDKTVDDAKHYGGLLLSLTETSFKRAKRLKANIAGDVLDAENWAKRHIHRVGQFKSQRFSAVQNIGSPADAQKWASETVSGAHSLASQIQSDVAAKPTEIATLGQRRVSEAMELAKLLNLEVNVAKSWVLSQRGTNAIWMRTMRENRQTAVAFLESQSSRIVMKATQHEKRLISQAIKLGTEELKDSKDTAKRSIAGAKAIAEDIVQGDREDRLAHEKGSKKDKDEIERPTAEGTIDLPDDPITLFHKDAPLILSGDGAEPDTQEGEDPKVEPRPAPPNKIQKPTPSATPGAEAQPVVSASTSPGKDKSKKAETKVVQGSEAPKESPPPTTKSKKGGKPESKNLPVAKTAPVPQEPARSNPSDLKPQPIKPEASGSVPIPILSTEPGKRDKEQSAPKVDSKVDLGLNILSITKGGKNDSASAKVQSATGLGKHESPPNQERSTTSSAKGPTPIGGGPSLKPAAMKAPATGETVHPPVPGAAPESEPKPTIAGVPTVVQKKGTGPEQPADPKQFHENLQSVSGPGEAPSPGTRQELAMHIGFDPAMVRIHTGPVAAAAAQSLKADAFTIGKDIYFADKQYDPTTPKGLGLIAHEATHVGQQLGLKGTKLQFNTKSGGDALEQEAQEIGERVASNLGYGNVLRVGRYVRSYEPADDVPVNSGQLSRLDRISMQALRMASRRLTRKGTNQPIRLDEVEVAVSLDLAEMSDGEAIEAWAEAIVAAVDAARPVGNANISVHEVLAPPSIALQARFGNKDPEPPPKQLDPAILAKLAKVNPSAQDKDMIRKLLVRKELDPMVSASKAKVRSKEIDDQYVEIGGVAKGVRFSGNMDDADMPAINAKLKEVDIASWADYLKLKGDFTRAFGAKGFNITNYILDENLRVVLEQKPRYLSKDADNPESQINKLKVAARKVLGAMKPYAERLGKVFGSVVNVDLNNLDDMDELILKQTASGDLRCPDKDANDLADLRKKWLETRRAEGNVHVVLLGKNYNPNTILNASSPQELEMSMLKYFIDVEKNIRLAKEKLTSEKFWELDPMIKMTKGQFGVHTGDGADKTIEEEKANKSNDAMLWNMIQAGAAMALAITAMVATGGIAAVALIGSAGLSVYGAAKHADEYMFKMAAANSSLDQANLLSKEEPALFWLALDLITAGLDLAAAAGAFKTLATIAKNAMAEKAALKELEAAARAQFKGLPGMKMTEDQFVARLLESAKKGVSGGESAAKQIRLATELIEATTPRAAAILKNDKVAIQAFVSEYGNWKGLMGTLSNGGEDAAKMAKNIGEFRTGIVNDLKARGAAPLEDASAEIASDFDLNVVSKDGKGAGERLLELESEMSSKFGKNWSESLLINFYTDKSQLLTVEQALKLVSGPKRTEILRRITEKAEKLNFAKMIEHAGDDATAVKQVEELMKATGVKYSVEDLKALAKTVHERGRDVLLKEIDTDLAALAKMKEGSPEAIAKAEEITAKQMEANFLSTEAYIGPGALKGGQLAASEIYQGAMSQLEMISHTISSCGGDIGKACREYELFKYINRYTAAARKAGIKSAKLDYFEGLSAYIYKRARSAHMETGGFPGVTHLDEAPTGFVDENFLKETYDAFRSEVKETLPKIRNASETNPAGAWRPEVKSPTPNSGPMEPKPGGGGGKPPEGPPSKPPDSLPPSTKPGGGSVTPEPSLPAAVNIQQASKMAKGSATKPLGPLDSTTAVQSAGYKGSLAGNEGCGVFKTQIPGHSGDVIVKVYPERLTAEMEHELGAAIAGEKTGIGPKVLGKIDAGEKKVGFAMEEVKGGFADEGATVLKPGSTEEDLVASAKNLQEAKNNAKNITSKTYEDLAKYRDSMPKQGYYYKEDLQGFVDASGNWRPVDMGGAFPLMKGEDEAAAMARHMEVFAGMENQLRMMEGIAKRGKK